MLNLKSLDDKSITLLERVKDNNQYMKKQNDYIIEFNNELKGTLDENYSKTLNAISTDTLLVTKKIYNTQESIYSFAEKLSNKLDNNNLETKELLTNIEKQNINLLKDVYSCSDTLNDYKASLIECNNQLKKIETIDQSIDETVNNIIQHSNEFRTELLKLNKITNDVNTIKTFICHHIEKLKEFLAEHFDEVEEQILSSQIQQGDIKDEINNLRIILDSIKNIFNHNNRNGNNIESYVDEKTGNIVENYYEEGVLIKSIMKQQNGNVIYELLYSEGNVEKSIQYNEEGKMSIEQIFFSNGEVHYRNEYTYKNGKTQKVVTEFDETGNKLK